jgi:selenium metabolism protein YedF
LFLALELHAAPPDNYDILLQTERRLKRGEEYMRTIDCRGLACPQPVVETKKALESKETQEVLVLLDNPGSKENVQRFAQSQGHRMSVSEEAGVFKVWIKKGESSSAEAKEEEKPVALTGGLVIFIDSDSIGRGSEELGRILMRSFLQTLAASGVKPRKIIFLNSGVKLACEGSEVLEDLQEFSLENVEILSCGTCLDYFGLKQKVKVGRISNMYEILTSLAQAGRILKI